jgi:hypothetical protein
MADDDWGALWPGVDRDTDADADGHRRWVADGRLEEAAGGGSQGGDGMRRPSGGGRGAGVEAGGDGGPGREALLTAELHAGGAPHGQAPQLTGGAPHGRG